MRARQVTSQPAPGAAVSSKNTAISYRYTVDGHDVPADGE